MSLTQQNGFPSFLADAAISANRRVVINSDGEIVAATAIQRGIGVTLADQAANASVAVQLYTEGVLAIEANTADTVTVGSVALAAANGQVSATATTAVTVGIFKTATTQDGGVVQVIPIV